MTTPNKDPWSTATLLDVLLKEYPEMEQQVRDYLWQAYIWEAAKARRLLFGTMKIDQNGNLMISTGD